MCLPGFPLWKRGTKGDSSLCKRGNLREGDRGDLIYSTTQMAATRVTPTIQVQNKLSEKDVILSKQSILTMEESKPEILQALSCLQNDRQKKDISQSKLCYSENGDGNILCPELVLKGLYVSGNNTGILCCGEGKPQIKENEIINNTNYGVYITDDAEPELGGRGHNCVYGSGLYDLYNNTKNE